MNYPQPHPDPHVVDWADWLPVSYEEVPDHLIDLWSAAWSHDGIVDALMYGEWPCCREITTGPTPRPTPPPPTPPCTCRYGLWYIPGAPGPYRRVDVPGVGKRAHTFAFKISPFCVHHGQGVWFGEALGEDEAP